MDADVLCAAEYTVNSVVGCLLAALLIFWGSWNISEKCCIFTTHIGENIKVNILDFTEESASKRSQINFGECLGFKSIKYEGLEYPGRGDLLVESKQPVRSDKL